MPSPVTVADLLAQRAWVRDLARRLVRDDSDADDLAQEAMVTALERPPRSREALRPWFRRVLVNRARDRHRSASRRAHHEQRTASGRTAPDPAELAAAADAHRLVIDAVMELPEHYRDIVLLRFFEGREPAQIAALRDMPASTVRTRLHRALSELRAELDRRHRGSRGAWIAALAPLVDVEASHLGGGESARPGRPAWRRPLAAAAAVIVLVGGAVALYGPSEDPVRTGDEEWAAGAPHDAERAARVRTRERVRAGTSGGTEDETAAAERTALPTATTSAEPPSRESGTARLPVRVSADERPVAGADVRVFVLEPGNDKRDPRDWTALPPLRTDELGQVALDVPIGKPVHLRARLGDLVAIHPPFQLPDASDRPVVALDLEPAFTLRGLVADTSGRPVAGARFISRIDVGDDDTLVRIAVTDASGRFEMAEVPRAAVDDIITFEVLAAGHVRGWGAVNDRTDLETPLAIELRPAATVTGRCVDAAGEPIPGVYVSWDRQHGTDTDGDGRFRLAGLPRDDLVLDLESESHVPLSHRVPTLRAASHDLGDIVLTTGVVARGVVTDALGRPQAGAHVQLYVGDAIVRQGETDASGHFAFEGVPDGTVRVLATARSEGGEWASPLEGTSGEVPAAAGPITVRLSAALSVVVDLRREDDGSVVSVPGLDIEVSSLAHPEERTSQGYVGGAMSSVRMRVAAPGLYRVVVEASGFAPWTAERVEITEQGETRLTARLRAGE